LDAVVVGLDRAGGVVQVHAVLLTEEGADPAAGVRVANGRLAEHQQVQAYTVWPDEDFPRTHTLKVKKQQVLPRLAELSPPPAPASRVSRDWPRRRRWDRDPASAAAGRDLAGDIPPAGRVSGLPPGLEEHRLRGRASREAPGSGADRQQPSLPAFTWIRRRAS